MGEKSNLFIGLIQSKAKNILLSLISEAPQHHVESAFLAWVFTQDASFVLEMFYQKLTANDFQIKEKYFGTLGKNNIALHSRYIFEYFTSMFCGLFKIFFASNNTGATNLLIPSLKEINYFHC